MTGNSVHPSVLATKKKETYVGVVMDTADDQVRLPVVVNFERPPTDRRQDAVFYKPRSESAVHQNDSTRKD